MYNIKFLVVALLCAAIGVDSETFSREEGIEAFKALSQDCMAQVHATDADFDAVVVHSPNPTSEGKCLRNCMMKKFNLLNNDGTLSVSRLVNLAGTFSNGNQEKIKNAEEIGIKCSGAASGEKNMCEIAYLYDKCMRDEIKTRHLDVQY